MAARRMLRRAVGSGRDEPGLYILAAKSREFRRNFPSYPEIDGFARGLILYNVGGSFPACGPPHEPRQTFLMSDNLPMHKFAPDQRDRHFRTDHLKNDLGQRAARGGAVTLTSQSLKFGIGIAATMLLARLLTPQDYGLIGMVWVITGFVAIFKDLGLSLVTIQREEINGKQISTLFWINVGLGLAVLLLTVIISPAVSWFYREPRLTLITIGFAAGFLFNGLAVQHEALLRRQMRFTVLSVLEIGSLVAGIVVAIICAALGARYWALVANQLTQTLVYASGVWIVCDWRPSRPARAADVRSMLSFGGNLTGFHVINYFARNLDNLLIGKFWGSWQLGLYAKAYQLLLLPIDQINSPIAAVAIPALSRLNDSPERYRSAYLRMLEKITMVTMPGMMFMIMTSDWIVAIALGQQWSDASRIFAVLGIAGMVQPLANSTGWLFISQGRTRDMFRWGMIGSVIMIASILAGLRWGGFGVATSYSLTFISLVLPLLIWFVGRSGPVRSRDFYRASLPAACSAGFVFAALFGLRHAVTISHPVYGLAASALLTGAVTFLVLIVLPKGRAALLDVRQSIALIATRNRLADV